MHFFIGTDYIRIPERGKKQMLNAVLELLPHPIGYLDSDFNFEFANEALRSWAEINITQIPGMHFKNCFSDKEWLLVRPSLESALRGHKTHLFTTFREGTPQIRKAKLWITPLWHSLDKKQPPSLIITLEDRTEADQQKKELDRVIQEYQITQRTAKIGFWQYEFATGTQTWSSEHYHLFEIPEPQPQEILFKMYRDRIHPDDILILDRIMERALIHGEDFVYNHRIVLDGGQRLKYVRGVGKITRDQNGNPILISGTCQDLTELVALQEQNKWILETMQIGIWKFNPLTQELFWDESMYKLFETDAKNFSGHYEAWESSLSSEAKERAIAELGQALRGEKEFNTTFEILTKSGIKKFIGGKGTVIRNELNEPIMMYGINWDRTQERKREFELEKTKKLLQDIIDAAPATIFVKGIDEKYLIANKAYCEILEKSAEEIQGKTVFDFFPHPVAQKMSARDQSVIHENRNQILEELLPLKGVLRWHLVSLFPIKSSDGIPYGVGGLIMDIQDTKDLKEKYEKELEVERSKSIHNSKLASLGEMSAGIAHEINNPLAILSGSLALIENYKKDETKWKAKVDTMKKAVMRIDRIVTGLKKFSRTSAGNIHKLESLKNIFNESKTITESKLKKYDTTLSVEVDENLQILCDEVEIEQVMINLINNAVDAIKDLKERWIKINAYESENQVIIRVMDSGAGIDVQIEEKIFLPFFTTKGVGEGTGLGLSISKGILDNHKASFQICRKTPNTCFEIRFPVASKK